MGTHPETAARAAAYRLKAEIAERAAETAENERSKEHFSGLAANYKSLAAIMENWSRGALLTLWVG
jgi:hypothetical protein